jgi:hypothetical protein
VPHRSSPMPLDLHPHRRPRRWRHHQHRRRSSVASGPSAAGDPARHLEPGRAGAPHHRPLKAGHRPATWGVADEERRRENGESLQIRIRGSLADRPAGHRLHHHRRHRRRSPSGGRL